MEYSFLLLPHQRSRPTSHLTVDGRGRSTAKVVGKSCKTLASYPRAVRKDIPPELLERECLLRREAGRTAEPPLLGREDRPMFDIREDFLDETRPTSSTIFILENISSRQRCWVGPAESHRDSISKGTEYAGVEQWESGLSLSCSSSSTFSDRMARPLPLSVFFSPLLPRLFFCALTANS